MPLSQLDCTLFLKCVKALGSLSRHREFDPRRGPHLVGVVQIVEGHVQLGPTTSNSSRRGLRRHSPLMPTSKYAVWALAPADSLTVRDLVEHTHFQN